MSARPCGCDPQENYVCRVHTEALEKAVDAFVAPEYEDATDVEEMGQVFGVIAGLASPTLTNEERAANHEKARTLFVKDVDAYSKRFAEDLDRYSRAVDTAADAIIARRFKRVAAVLATFYRAPLSMSSVAPILALAEELNPGLKETK